MADTNEVDTHITDDVNTETELDNLDSGNELDEQDGQGTDDKSGTDDSGSSDDKQEPERASDDIISELSDEELLAYAGSGKLPDRLVESGNKEGDDNESTSSGQKDKQRDSDTRNEGKRSGNEKGESERRNADSGQKENVRKNIDSDSKDSSKDGSTGNTDSVDYKAAYETIFKPFKANGKEIAPRTPEDVISLMQMGANYTKKMQLMAPMRKTFESLNRAEIGEQDLNFLIDLHKGDKEAIKKLLEKHKVDPIDLDMDNTNYVPKNNMLSDADVEYSEALDDIQSSIPKIQEIITSKWDKQSKELLLEDPNLMKALHEEIQMGRFDEVQNRLEIEKTFGRYKGTPDVKAYIDIVTKMVNSQSTNSNTVNKNVANNGKPTNTPKQAIPDKSKAAPNKAVKAAPSGNKLTQEDILSMSDEDIMKLSVRNLV